MIRSSGDGPLSVAAPGGRGSLLPGRHDRLHLPAPLRAVEQALGRAGRLPGRVRHRRVARPPARPRPAPTLGQPLLLPVVTCGRPAATRGVHRTPRRAPRGPGRPAAPGLQCPRAPIHGHERGAHLCARSRPHRPRAPKHPGRSGVRLLPQPDGSPRPVHLPDGRPHASGDLGGVPVPAARTLGRPGTPRDDPVGAGALIALQHLRPGAPAGGFRRRVPARPARPTPAPHPPACAHGGRGPGPGPRPIPRAVLAGTRRARSPARPRPRDLVRHGCPLAPGSRCLQPAVWRTPRGARAPGRWALPGVRGPRSGGGRQLEPTASRGAPGRASVGSGCRARPGRSRVDMRRNRRRSASRHRPRPSAEASPLASRQGPDPARERPSGAGPRLDRPGRSAPGRTPSVPAPVDDGAPLPGRLHVPHHLVTEPPDR
jgi:hypothetical protein